MVTVVATQELEAGDVLLRFEAEASQHEPRRGNENNGCIVYTLGSSHVCVVFFLLCCCSCWLVPARARARVCVCVCVCVCV